SFVLFWTYFL
ncbi:hypothetical protein CISIN_1g0312912mg, partial [Citrus sinensis]